MIVQENSFSIRVLTIFYFLWILADPLKAQSLQFPAAEAEWSYTCIVDYRLSQSNQRLLGDSLFQGKVYQKISSSNVPIRGDDSGLIRVDGAKVFFIPRDSTQELLLYQFDLEVGDTLQLSSYFLTDPIEPFVLQSIDTIITADGLARRRYRWPTGTEWIEGIGAEYGSVTFPFYLPSLSGDCYLRCLQVDGKEVFEEPITWQPSPGYRTYTYDCNGLVVSTQSPDQSAFIQVQPNPFQDVLYLETAGSQSPQTIRLYDLLGRAWQEWPFQEVLHFSTHVVPGVYLLELDYGEYRTYQKVIRQ